MTTLTEPGFSVDTAGAPLKTIEDLDAVVEVVDGVSYIRLQGVGAVARQSGNTSADQVTLGGGLLFALTDAQAVADLITGLIPS